MRSAAGSVTLLPKYVQTGDGCGHRGRDADSFCHHNFGGGLFFGYHFAPRDSQTGIRPLANHAINRAEGIDMRLAQSTLTS